MPRERTVSLWATGKVHRYWRRTVLVLIWQRGLARARSEFEIYHGDTLINDRDMLLETNPAKKPVFDTVVANPAFSYRWEPGEPMGEDMRFKAHGVAPECAADFAFLLHGSHFLKDDGVMAIILPPGTFSGLRLIRPRRTRHHNPPLRQG